MKSGQTQQQPEVIFDPNTPDLGTFDLDGSWNPKATERTSCYKFVDRLVVRRRRTRESPAYIAEVVRTSPFPNLLGRSLGEWLTHERWEDWPLTRYETSAGGAIRHEGHAVSGRVFFGGKFLTLDEGRRFVASSNWIITMTPEADFRAELHAEAARGNDFAIAFLKEYQSA